MRWPTRFSALAIVALVALAFAAPVGASEQQLSIEQMAGFPSDAVIEVEVEVLEVRALTSAAYPAGLAEFGALPLAWPCYNGSADYRGKVNGVHIFTFRMWMDYCAIGGHTSQVWVNGWGGWPTWTAVGFVHSGTWDIGCQTAPGMVPTATCSKQVAYTGCLFGVCKQNYYTLRLQGDEWGNLYYV